MVRGHRDDHGRVKVRIVDFELEGSNASIQESLRSLTSALRARGEAIALPATRAPAAAFEAPSLTGEILEPTETLVEQTGSETIRPRQNAGTKSRPRIYRSPDILELDLDSRDVSFRRFCEIKNPESDWEKYLVIASWLKKYHNVNSVTPAHVYTCYQFMGWQVPRDIPQPLRDMKSKKGWFSKGDERGAYTINHVGENKVKEMGG